MKYQLGLPLLLAVVAAAPAALETRQDVCTPACGSKTAACCSGDAPFGGVIAFEVRSSFDIMHLFAGGYSSACDLTQIMRFARIPAWYTAV